MTDREKVIRGLQNRINESRNHGGIAVTVALSTLSKALVLLKEQEPQMVHAMQRPGGITYFCPRCRNPVEYFYAGEFNHYCAFCGQAINFETIHWMTPPDRSNEECEGEDPPECRDVIRAGR